MTDGYLPMRWEKPDAGTRTVWLKYTSPRKVGKEFARTVLLNLTLDGKPFEKARVGLTRPGDNAVLLAKEKGDGQYEVTGVSPGKYQIVVQGFGPIAWEKDNSNRRWTVTVNYASAGKCGNL